jgi:hypothetical protein
MDKIKIQKLELLGYKYLRVRINQFTKKKEHLFRGDNEDLIIYDGGIN